ncbi:MAG: HAD family hydrolase [Cellvibrio sp.]
MALAIFDLDNTLLGGDSDHAWGQFLVDRQLADAETYRKANDYFYEQYQNGTLNIDEFLEFSLKPLTQYSMDELAAFHEDFMESCIVPMMLPKAEALLNEHRAKGDYLLIITATNGFITRPIGKRLGVDDILATDPEILNGAYTGKYVGTPTFQSGKVTRLNEWLQDHPFDLSDAYFYSDSINDLPLLEKVGNPVAVDADPRLTELARARQWKEISLR